MFGPGDVIEVGGSRFQLTDTDADANGFYTSTSGDPEGELWVRPIGRDVRLRLTAESPLKYFDQSPVLRLSLGGDEIARLSPGSDFTWEVTMPAAKLAAADGRVVIESNESFVPGGTSGGDQRNLAIRVYRLAVD